MWLSRAVYRIILQEVLARWQVAQVQREAQNSPDAIVIFPPSFFLFSFSFKNYSKPQTHVRPRGTAKSCRCLARSLHVSPVRTLHFSSGSFPYSLCLRCLCFYDHSSDPSPPLLLTQLRCITQAVVVALYLAPASRLPSWRVRCPTQMHKARLRAPESELMTSVTSVKSCCYGPPVSSCPSLNQRWDLCSLKGQMPIWQVDCWCCMVGRFIWPY